MSITPYQQNNAQVAVPDQPSQQASAVAQLVEWAHGAKAAHEVAINLVNTSFCPVHYRGKPHEATAAILAGLEVGLQPMAALQAFNPIQGSAAPKAITLRAIVQSKGHDIWVEEQSTTRAVVAGRRKGSDQVQRSVWTIERAEEMGLPKKNPNWRTQAPAMLVARASGECARMIASDAILGIPYAFEELEDDAGPVVAVAEQVAPRPARRRNQTSLLPTAAATPVQAPEPIEEASPVEDAPAAAEPAPAAGDRMTQEQQGHLLAAIRESDVDDRWGWASGVLGRDVTSYGQLSGADADRLIADLSQDGDQQ